MTATSPVPKSPARRRLLAAGLGMGMGIGAVPAQADGDVQALLRAGGVVIAFRHATAPGTFDPPQFRLGDCGTQRNLSEAGRAQARRLGEWFAQRQLQPAHVKSSPWCRCIDTAALAFRPPQIWPALGSPHGAPETTGAGHLRELRDALQRASQRPGEFEVWVTHMFVLQDLAEAHTQSGEGLVLQTQASGTTRLLARLLIA